MAKKLNKKVKKIILILLSILSALLVAVFTVAVNIYFYGIQKTVTKADAAIVLGAAVWEEKPSPVFRERINHAIALYQKGDIQKIIFTGGVGEVNEPAESVVAMNYAIARGVKKADIAIETKSRTTRQNLMYAQKVANSHYLKKFLIVSDPLHLKRSVLMAQDLGMDAYPSPTLTTRYRSFKSQMEFLARETYFYFVYLLFKS
ncbi:MAG: YdcF family protein [Hydrococcus sp. RU_2_2]|nr:YdcF family protein [Hydrococcus sp. RU_2_2]NJP19086.1 YdcF family protein [Hydrococcus sp. CRU_1_1]